VADHPFAIVEATGGRLSTNDHAATLSSLRELGAAIVLGATDLDHCDALRAVMLEDLPRAMAQPAALEVPGHIQHNPRPGGEHLYADIVANPIALAVANDLLGPVQLALYTGNTMLGGTIDQQPVHWDYPQLWPAVPADMALPAPQLTVNIPLQDVRVENGALEVWPGTHLDNRSGEQHAVELYTAPLEWVEAQRREVPPVRVPVPRGALLLRDGRMWHRGTTNTTDEPRVMVALAYHARWFRPMVIDFHDGAQEAVAALGIPVAARYRRDFDDQVWPPPARLVPEPAHQPAQGR
jgi:hypothetical protein